MDVFALAKHEYLQPPISKQGRHSSNQQNQHSSSNASNAQSGNDSGRGGSTGTALTSKLTFFSGSFVLQFFKFD